MRASRSAVLAWLSLAIACATAPKDRTDRTPPVPSVPGSPSPVLDFDRPPRAVRMTRPRYPQAAYLSKIEGTVEVEILIDEQGNVAAARITRSVPALDRAALECVAAWKFEPAMKDGRPVRTTAVAPVAFRIY